MKNLFSALPPNFFNPLTGKSKEIICDCILRIFNTYKRQISYGIDKTYILNELQAYFETNNTEISFDDEEILVSDARSKANEILRVLKKYGWIEEEVLQNHIVQVQLAEYAIPVIESFNKIIKDEETEYQGVIYRIHTILQNVEQSQKPYEEIILGIRDNTASLISELKRLSSSIKRKIDELTKQMTVAEILEHFTSYNSTIISQAYYRLKTSENISHFRPTILSRLDVIITNNEIMQRAIAGYKIVNGDERNPIEDESARERIIEIIDDVKYNFRHLDDIIEGIDTKNTQYIKNAVNRAQFLLTSGMNTEGKLSYLLKQVSDEINSDGNFWAETSIAVNEIFSIYPQRFISDESLRVIPVRRGMETIDKIEKTHTVSEKERKEFIQMLKERNARVFSRKNIDSYVLKLLEQKERVPVTEIPVHELRDFIRIIYIVIYSSDSLNCYFIERGKGKVTLQGGYTVNNFTVVKKDLKNA